MALVTGLRKVETCVAILLSLALLLACASPLAAQQKKKNKKDSATDSNSSKTVIPMGDQQQIDYMISEMLGAWQLGDVEKMHEDYADDVSVVNGGWAPPITGWSNYATLYKQQRDRMQQVRMDRLNTYIGVHGDAAWASYQWDFSAVVNGQPTAARGQTTLVLLKLNNKWKIVHDHTSIVQPPHTSAPASNSPSQPPPQSEKPGS